MTHIPAKARSYWREVYKGSNYPTLHEEIEVDAVVIGAGITGLTTAYLLKQAGLKVAVLEKTTVGGGTTGRTTGKVTSQHNLIYADLEQRLGSDTARIYGQINQAALEKVNEIIAKEKIDCSWQREDNYVYTADDSQIASLQREAGVAANLGLPATYVTQTPLPFDVKAAVKFTNQGKLHAQEYVLGLAASVNGNGSHVFEHSNVIGIRDSEPGRVRTKNGRVTAKHIIVATNVPTLPLAARGAYCLLEYPTESYIVAGRLPTEFPGMYISPDSNQYSILPFTHGEERYLLIGGEGHLSGARISRESKFEKLTRYAQEKFGIEQIEFKWSDRDYLSYDGPPLAGKLYPWSKNLYVASAFRKWGLTNGTASAMIIHDLIIGQPNPAAKVYNPNRLQPIKYIPRTAIKLLTGS